MDAMRSVRHDAGQLTEFCLHDVDDDLTAAALRSGFAARDGHLARAFPSDAPHLDRAWANFQRSAGPWLRQLAGLEPVPWQNTLEAVCPLLDGAGVDWWLTGSAALAVRGAGLTPGDLDLVVAGGDAHRVGDLLLDHLVEPVSPVDWFCDFWGRAFPGARVEWVGGVGPSADTPDVTDFGPAAEARLDTVLWHGHPVRVPPLDLQRAVSLRRGLHDRVAMIDALAA
jgi:hypothetical protein